MSVNRSLIHSTANPRLEQALRQQLAGRAAVTGSMGELEPLAIRLGLIQNRLQPRFDAPQLAIFAADHGLAVEGIGRPGEPSTAQLATALLTAQLPVAAFARMQGLALSVVDCGIAEAVAPHAQLLARKIAHGSRNTRVTAAMSLEQTHAAIRAGMEIGDAMAGNAVACAGIGVGSHESAALLLARLSGVSLGGFLAVDSDPTAGADPARLLGLLQSAHARHKAVIDPVEVLAAFGGFDMAMMVGLMLVAGSKRHLIVVDGVPACAALMVAARIAPAVTDYCLFSRSHAHPGLDQALALFDATALLELGMAAIDGTGATLAWPLVRCAAALLGGPAEADEPAGLPPTVTGAWADEASSPATRSGATQPGQRTRPSSPL